MTLYKFITNVFTAIQIPPAMCKRGRPKGHAVTVIGLPAKKRTRSSEKVKLTPFIHLHSSIKEKGIVFQNIYMYICYLLL